MFASPRRSRQCASRVVQVQQPFAAVTMMARAMARSVIWLLCRSLRRVQSVQRWVRASAPPLRWLPAAPQAASMMTSWSGPLISALLRSPHQIRHCCHLPRLHRSNRQRRRRHHHRQRRRRHHHRQRQDCLRHITRPCLTIVLPKCATKTQSPSARRTCRGQL